MSKKQKEVQLTMDMLLKMTPEIFIDVMKAQTIGFKMSLRNLLQAQYEQCNMFKEALITTLAKGNMPVEDEEQCKKNINDLYMCMQLLEDRYNILQALIQELN